MIKFVALAITTIIGCSANIAESNDDPPYLLARDDFNTNFVEIDEFSLVCAQSLSDVGKDNFRISFTIAVLPTSKQMAVLNQRSECSNVSSYWDVRMGHYCYASDVDGGDTCAYGLLAIEVGGSPYIGLVSPYPIDDGAEHKVVILRNNGMLSMTVDNNTPTIVPCDDKLEALPEMLRKEDVCDGVDGTVKLDGKLTDVCATPGLHL
jgi:hypothetical protein